MTDGLVPSTDCSPFGANVTVGVDLHLDAAVGEDALGDDGDEIDAFDLLADDERGRLVVGIGGARADRGDEALSRVDELSSARLAGVESHGLAARLGALL